MLSSLNARWDQWEGDQKWFSKPKTQGENKLSGQNQDPKLNICYCFCFVFPLQNKLSDQTEVTSTQSVTALVGPYKNSVFFSQLSPCSCQELSPHWGSQAGWDNRSKGGGAARPPQSCSLRSPDVFIYMLTLGTSRQNTNGVGFFKAAALVGGFWQRRYTRRNKTQHTKQNKIKPTQMSCGSLEELRKGKGRKKK